VLHYRLSKSIRKQDVLSCWPDYGYRSHNNENVVLLKLEFLAVQVIEGIVFEGKEQAFLTDIWRDNRLSHQEGPIARAARELWQLSIKSIHSLKWSEVNSFLLFCGKIYVPDICNLYRYTVSLYYNNKVARHAGYWKTLELVSWSYWWPQISRYVGQYVSICDLCL